MSTPERITVVGAGLMGHGIAQIFAVHGHPVWLLDNNEDTLNSAKDRVRANLTNMAKQGVDLSADIEEILEHISTTADLATACEDCDFVFEAVYENLELKQQVFADLDRLCPPKAIGRSGNPIGQSRTPSNPLCASRSSVCSRRANVLAPGSTRPTSWMRWPTAWVRKRRS